MAGVKHDKGKTRWELLPPEIVFAGPSCLEREAWDILSEWYAGLNDGALIRAFDAVCDQLGDTLGEAVPAMAVNPFAVPRALVQVLEFGARKYADYNWESGIAYSRCYAAAKRHLEASARGETADVDTGLHPLAHAACEIAFLLTFEARGMGAEWDDRPCVRRSKAVAAEPIPVCAPLGWALYDDEDPVMPWGSPHSLCRVWWQRTPPTVGFPTRTDAEAALAKCKNECWYREGIVAKPVPAAGK